MLTLKLSRMRFVPLVLIAWALVCCAPAQAGFAPQNDSVVLTPQASDATGIATDSKGNTLLAWDQLNAGLQYELHARWLSAGGHLGPTIELSPGGFGFKPVAAMGPSGAAFVAWRVLGGVNGAAVMGRWVNPDGSLGPLLTLETPETGKFDAVEVAVVVDSTGVATVAWKNEDSLSAALELRRVSPESTTSATVPNAGTDVVELEMAALPDGSTLAVWRGAGIQENTVSPSLAVGTQQTISSNNLADGPEVAVNSHGNGLVTWRESLEAPFSVRGIRLSPSGAPLGEELIIDPNGPGSLSTTNAISANSNGNFLVTWTRYDEASKGVIYARGVNSEGAFTGPREQLSENGADAETAQSAIDDGGNGAVVWSNNLSPASNMLGREIGLSGAPIGATSELSPISSQPVVASAPELGFAAFFFDTGEGAVVRRFLEPPVCTSSTATVTQGQPIVIPLACIGPAIQSTQVSTGPSDGSLGAINPADPSVTFTPKVGFEGTDSFTYTATNEGGTSNKATVTIKVEKASVKPKIKSFRLVKSKHGGRFVVKFTEPCKVGIVVERTGKGRGGHRVIGRTKSKQFSPSVVIPVRGRLSRKFSAGGRFRATATAINQAGNASTPKRLNLKFHLPGSLNSESSDSKQTDRLRFPGALRHNSLTTPSSASILARISRSLLTKVGVIDGLNFSLAAG